MRNWTRASASSTRCSRSRTSTSTSSHAELRAFAEAPDLYTSKPPGFRHVVTERYSLLLGADTHVTNVQLLRAAPEELDAIVAEVRERVAAEGHRRARWWVPERLAAAAGPRLEALGLFPNADEPVLACMALAAPPPPGPPDVEARLVRSEDEYRAGVEIELDAFGLHASLHEEIRDSVPRRYKEEHAAGQAPRFLALIDGEPVATATAITAERGLFLIGGATREAARGRGAYRALVRARWDFAEARGTPGLVVTAGRNSRPILERLGFEEVARVRLFDNPQARERPGRISSVSQVCGRHS